MTTQLDILNCLRPDFKRWAVSNEPNTWELDVNKIGKKLSAFGKTEEPVILLDCTDSEGDWFLCVNTDSVNEIGCFPFEDLSDDTKYEIRKIVETWLARKDVDFFGM